MLAREAIDRGRDSGRRDAASMPPGERRKPRMAFGLGDNDCIAEMSISEDEIPASISFKKNRIFRWLDGIGTA